MLWMWFFQPVGKGTGYDACSMTEKNQFYCSALLCAWAVLAINLQETARVWDLCYSISMAGCVGTLTPSYMPVSTQSSF